MSPPFVLWLCCKCNGTLNTLYIVSCCECHHYRCQFCDHEAHRASLLSCHHSSNPFDFSTKVEPEDVLLDVVEADGPELHDEDIVGNTSFLADDESQESPVPLDLLNLRVSTPISCEVSDTTRIPLNNTSNSIDSGTEMKLEIHQKVDALSVEEQEVETRKNAIWHNFEDTRQKFSHLKMNALKDQKKLSPYHELLRDPTCFAFAWERSVLLLLREFSSRWFGPKYTINVLQGTNSKSRVVAFMTGNGLSWNRQEEVKRHVVDMLPSHFHDTTSFRFYTGSIEHLVGRRGTSEVDEDYCKPRNPFYYSNPMMGDSIGASDNDQNASTMGPCLSIDGKGYWLLNFHPFQYAFGEKEEPEEVITVHPAVIDQKSCNADAHSSTQVGVIEAICGNNGKTTRISCQAGDDDDIIGSHRVVVDWALSTAGSVGPNLSRKQESQMRNECQHVTEIDDVMPGASVFSVGRSSGFQVGQICLTPSVVSAEWNGTGVETREWAVERQCPDNDSTIDEIEWVSGGIGVSGDSGAAIIDLASNKLYGCLWGRNAYFGEGARVAYFTEINDIFNDIREKYQFSDIRLPPCDDVEENSQPACLNCQEKLKHQDRCSNGSLTVKAGSPRSTLDLDIDSFSYGASPLFREHRVTDSSTNVTDDMIRSPESAISPHPHLGEDWLAGLALTTIGVTGQGGLCLPFPLNLDDNDFLEPIESGPYTVPNKPEEQKRSYTHDPTTGRIVLDNPQKKQKISPDAPGDDGPAEGQDCSKSST